MPAMLQKSKEWVRRGIIFTWQLRFLRLVVVLALLAAAKHAFGLGKRWRETGRPPWPLGLGPAHRRPAPLANPQRTFLVVSSDDWGRWTDAIPLFPDLDFVKQHPELQVAPTDFWYRLASVETREDLQTLENTLNELNAGADYERRVVLTPHWIVAGPDFEAMRALSRPMRARCAPSLPANGGECSYRELLISESAGGLAHAPYHRGDLRAEYQRLFHQELWHPEFHGRSHFAVNRWLEELNVPNSAAAACFNYSLVCSADPMTTRSEFDWFTEHQDLRAWLVGGVRAFQHFWGYRPRVISSPHNTWTPWLADAAAAAGFVAASIGDDQRLYRMDGGMSLDQRLRFDAFFPGFDCSASIDSVVERLNRTRYVTVMWHAQNAMRSTYSEPQYREHYQCLRRLIAAVRERSQALTLVTGSEMHQLRARGWSVEVWRDSLVYRNYSPRTLAVKVQDLAEFIAAPSWNDSDIRVETLAPKAAHGEEAVRVRVGETLRVESDTVVRLRAPASEPERATLA
ncbi:hypothetical protein CDCA_CDCA04G1420 [Cyanidium caldarium]|uniref:Glycoside hydrolase family 42 N-terminal domain-containing protein n=1 Tax=Cyanidium caldarium TaxID=2771 RepID=A0AAV9ITG1_CYACA|nr:hypothetical protein CDCA_CDCA04G1420 [Cyanidium caldarium]